MKKLVSSFLLVIILIGSFLPNMDTCELSKIPQLINHYKEHTELRKQSISFIDFILLHYGVGKESAEHQNQEDHNNLPLHEHTFHSLLLDVIEPVSFSFCKFKSIHLLNVEYLYSKYSEYSFRLLLPPKL
ncbi:MAG TPA: hypothetical protein VK766_03175 [Cytophagaceae bacterium]|jgi:hypothetical protein|nr:hypothetical protein [Cytophagaceae bacterium]